MGALLVTAVGAQRLAPVPMPAGSGAGAGDWISREYPGVRFERFADDAVIHCVTERQAWEVREAIGRRFADIGLSLHPEKTKIVYCKDDPGAATVDF